ncbi:MAG: N-formylglutamate amidohydrolase [Rhodobacteraceae bacterium]|nr:N-formylglutamate amidohydrolase [Paracoccaceae bacterium]
MTPREFYLYLPETISTGVVFGSPHSGRDYPADFIKTSRLTMAQIRSSEDAFVDELFASATRFGAPLLAASTPRAYIDLNRGANELDPAVVADVKPVGNNPRVASGLGVIPRVVAEGRVIQSGKISREQAEERVQRYYRPYHSQLRELLDTSCEAFGQVLLIDCHSMPHEALTHASRVFGQTPEVVLGDRFGTSCDPHIVDQIEMFFAQAGFRVTRNSPYAGAYISQTYGRPSSNRFALQIEIDRSLYMNEGTITKSASFDKTRKRLEGVIEQVCDLARWTMQLAAE